MPVHNEKEKGISRTDAPPRRDQAKQSIMEKQVNKLYIPRKINFLINKLIHIQYNIYNVYIYIVFYIRILAFIVSGEIISTIYIFIRRIFQFVIQLFFLL